EYTVSLPKTMTDISGFQNVVTVEIPNTNVSSSRVSQGGAFPVELSGFRGEWNENMAQLSWATASELNNQGFEVEHSLDDVNYEVLGFVEGKGTTQSPQTYTFETRPLQEGRHIFRLRQIDISGGYAFSPRVKMDLGLPEPFKLAVGPNPFEDRVQVKLEVAETQRVKLSVFDQRGVLIRDQYVRTIEAGSQHTVDFEMQGLAAGMYLLKVQGHDFQTVRRLIRK
ncbi:MAG: T9SS type A sorting domain-containing protein, partial [Bacteroidota bacterium]